MSISAPQSALARVVFDRHAVKLTVDRPEDAELFAELFAEIGFDSARSPIDAFQTAADALTVWETLAFPLAGV